MLDLTTIDTETKIARGEYSTVRAAHEDEKKRLSILCGQLSSTSSQVLRYMQPSEDDAPDGAAVDGMVTAARATLEEIEKCVKSIEGLAKQRTALRQSAWGRK